MNRDQERYSPSSGSPAVTRALPSILRQVKENSLSILTNQLNEFFNSCDDLFFELANRASSNNEQNLYFDSMREIRLHKNDVINQFKDHFNSLFTEILRPNLSKVASPYDQHAASIDSLGLVEEEKIEQDVAISSIISKTRQDCQENLYHLTLRFDYLLSDIQVNESNQPLDPKQICEAFTKAAARINLDIKARIILFKQYDRMVARHLDKIYTLANELLINAGILPKVVPAAVKNQNSQRPEPVTPIATEPKVQSADPNQAPQASAATTYSFEQLASLLAGLRAPGGENGGYNNPISASGAGYGQPISQQALLDKLTDLQKRVGQAQAPQTREQFQTAIYHILQSASENGKPSSLEQSDEDVINLVSMFFEFILDDRNLPVPIQALVSRLQIPVLKIALKDKRFFSNSEHVARILINDIAALSIGWNESNQDQQDKFFDLVNDIVHKINDEFVGDLIVFERELKRLQEYQQIETRRATIVETRTSQAAEGKAKTDHTRELVQNILLQRINSQELPAVVSNLLINHWQKLLVLIKLKTGDNSPEWLSHLQVLDDLVWISQPHGDERSQKRAERIKPFLLQSIAKGLAAVNMPESDRDSLCNQLDRAITGLLGDPRENNTKRQKLSAEQLTLLGQAPEGLNRSWKEMSALERQQVKQRALHFENIKKAESLKVGTWFTLEDEKSGRTTRCKLASYIEPNERFVFVNRFGQKTAEKSKQEVAMALQKQLLTPLDTGLLFDRAMSGLVSNLKRVGTTAQKTSG